MGFYTYQNSVAAIDGGGANGTYKWTFNRPQIHH